MPQAPSLKDEPEHRLWLWRTHWQVEWTDKCLRVLWYSTVSAIALEPRKEIFYSTLSQAEEASQRRWPLRRVLVHGRKKKRKAEKLFRKKRHINKMARGYEKIGCRHWHPGTKGSRQGPASSETLSPSQRLFSIPSATGPVCRFLKLKMSMSCFALKKVPSGQQPHHLECARSHQKVPSGSHEEDGGRRRERRRVRSTG